MTSLPPSAEQMVCIDQLTVTKSGRTICRLEELELKCGERLGVSGPNGSGKTTLLRVVAGLERDYRGGCRVAVESGRRMLVQQAPFLFRGTVSHNVAFGLAARSVKRQERRELVERWLDRFGIGPLANRRIERLSGGERRRVALARACILRPQLLLLDEPLVDLDRCGCRSLQEVLTQELAESTVVITSPNPLPPELVDRSIRLVPIES